MAKLTRRDFLIGCSNLTAISVISPWFKPQHVRAAATPQDFPRAVVAEGTSDDTPAQILQTALEGIGGIERFVKAGQTVAIKPNATWAYPPHTASSTDPDFLRAVIQAVQKAGAGRIIVMDHCSIEPGADEALRISGIGQVINDLGVEGVFLDRFDAPPSMWTKIDLPYGKASQRIGVIKAAVEADVRINLAVAKTHNVAGLTMCLKHMMGFLQKPGLLHAHLEQGIADLSTPSPIQAQLHLLEAIRVRLPLGNYQVCAGPETDVTHPKIVARRNMVLAGIDPVLIDAYGSIYLFGLQPQEVPHLLLANESGCGDLDVETALTDGRIRSYKVGESIQTPSAAAPTINAIPQPEASKPTAIVIPTAASVEQTRPLSASDNASCSTASPVIAPGPLLNTILIPAAAIVTGLSLAALNRLRKKLPKGQSDTENDPATRNSESQGKGR